MPRKFFTFCQSSECGPRTSVTSPGVANIGSHCLKNLFYWQIYTAHLMDFLSSNIVSDNIVSDYPVLRSEMFAKLSLSLFSTDIETCPLLFFTFANLCLPVISFQGQTTDAFVESFKSPPGKGKNHCYVCFAQVPNIFNLLSHKISQKHLHSEARRASRKWEAKWTVDRREKEGKCKI